ncbi:hypothetical protein QN224_28090 [Sinorhizobium sp. 8-89]|nr:hypothetical protein [Sinorhizobium sp. 7-81]MDK1389271.1 hypothetical protein [Sinorhizobium sp. 7-81]
MFQEKSRSDLEELKKSGGDSCSRVLKLQRHDVSEHMLVNSPKSCSNG